MKFKLYPKQREIIESIKSNNHTCNKICLGRLSGKTAMSIVLAKELAESGLNVIHISPNLEIARFNYNTCISLSDDDICYNTKNLKLQYTNSTVIFTSGQQYLFKYLNENNDNINENNKIIIVDEPTYLLFKTVSEQKQFLTM